MKTKVIDLHCDLLGSVDWSKGEFDFDTPRTCCSVPQLEAGGVSVQVLAVAGITDFDPGQSGENQIKLYRDLLSKYSDRVARYEDTTEESDKIRFLLAIENASVLAEEGDPLEKAFERFNRYNDAGRILYVSLMWNQENRFGGGNASSAGLKDDGKVFLDFMHGKKVAIDLSHTSDVLAGEILDHIDKKGLDIPVIASHSNYRPVKNHLRNLTDEFAKEIIRRKGIIGVNFVRRFVGSNPEEFINHIQHGLEIGGEHAICLGADFYGAVEIPEEYCPGRLVPPFFEKFPNAGCFPHFRESLENTFSDEVIEALFNKNAVAFLQKYC